MPGPGQGLGLDHGDHQPRRHGQKKWWKSRQGSGHELGQVRRLQDVGRITRFVEVPDLLGAGSDPESGSRTSWTNDEIAADAPS